MDSRRRRKISIAAPRPTMAAETIVHPTNLPLLSFKSWRESHWYPRSCSPKIYEEVEPRRLCTMVDRRCTMQGMTCCPFQGEQGVFQVCLSYREPTCQGHVLSWESPHPVAELRQGYKGSAISAQHGTTLMSNTHSRAPQWSGWSFVRAAPQLSFSLCPILLLPLSFLRCWSPMTILHLKLHLSICF